VAALIAGALAFGNAALAGECPAGKIGLPEENRRRKVESFC
jgi:hypothetical protein